MIAAPLKAATKPDGARTTIYHAVAEDLLWADWEDLSTVFHRCSGETHVLDALAAEVLSILAHRGCNIDEATRQLSERCGSVPDDAWRQKTTQIVQALQQLGLIQTDGPGPQDTEGPHT